MPDTVAQGTDALSVRELFEEEIRGGRLSLPVLPDVAMRMKQEAAKPASGAAELARVLEKDPALSARILKMANSAMFAGRAEIRNLDTAIGRLGPAMAVAIVVGAAGKEVFNSTTDEFNQFLTDNWKAALFASGAARLISKRVGLKAEDVFLAGLLNGCGEAVLVQAAEEAADEGRLVPKPSLETLREAIGPIGPEAGAAVLSKWGLPESLVQSVRYQKNSDQADDEFRSMATMVGLSGSIGRKLQAGEPASAVAEAVSAEPGAAKLELDRASLENIVTQAASDGLELASTI